MRKGRPRKLSKSETRMLMAEYGMWRYYSPKRIQQRFGLNKETFYQYVRRGLNERVL